MSNGPYSRLYHELADEFPDIYDSPALAAYVRLLVAADQAWPSKARWAGYATPDEVEALRAAGLIVVDDKRYSVKGLDKERKRRSSHARKAAEARHGQSSEQEASTALSRIVSTAQTMPRREETSKEEPRKEETRRTARDRSRGLEPLSEFLGGVK